MFNKVDEVIGLLFFKGILFLTKSQMVSNWSRSPPKMSMFRSQTSVAGLLRHGPERFGYLNGFENTNENDCEWIRIMKWRYSLESMDLHPSKHPYSCIAHDVYIYIYIYLYIYIHTLYSVACLQIFPERKDPFWTVPRLPSQVEASPFLSQWQALAAPWRELQSSMSPSSAAGSE